MRFTVRVKRGAIGVLAVGTFVGALVLGTLPATAATAPTNQQTPAQLAASKLVTHPDRDWMGSTIKAHEAQTMTVKPAVSGPLGLDVSGWQGGGINWTTVANNGAKFYW